MLWSVLWSSEFVKTGYSSCTEHFPLMTALFAREEEEQFDFGMSIGYAVALQWAQRRNGSRCQQSYHSR